MGTATGMPMRAGKAITKPKQISRLLRPERVELRRGQIAVVGPWQDRGGHC